MKVAGRRLGEHLRALRLQRRLTQEQVAEQVDIHPTHLQKLEAGDRLPSLGTLIRLASVLGTPVSAIASALDAPEHRPSPGEALRSEVQVLIQRCRSDHLKSVRDFVEWLMTRGE